MARRAPGPSDKAYPITANTSMRTALDFDLATTLGIIPLFRLRCKTITIFVYSTKINIRGTRKANTKYEVVETWPTVFCGISQILLSEQFIQFIPSASGSLLIDILLTLTTPGIETMIAYNQTRKTRLIGFLLDFKAFMGWTMFWYLSVAMAAKLINVAEVKVLENKDRNLHWMLSIFDVVTNEYTTIGPISKRITSSVTDRCKMKKFEVSLLKRFPRSMTKQMAPFRMTPNTTKRMAVDRTVENDNGASLPERVRRTIATSLRRNSTVLLSCSVVLFIGV